MKLLIERPRNVTPDSDHHVSKALGKWEQWLIRSRVERRPNTARKAAPEGINPVSRFKVASRPARPEPFDPSQLGLQPMEGFWPKRLAAFSFRRRCLSL